MKLYTGWRLAGTLVAGWVALATTSYLDGAMHAAYSACWRGDAPAYRVMKDFCGVGVFVALAVFWQLAMGAWEKRGRCGSSTPRMDHADRKSL